jgi:integrase
VRYQGQKMNYLQRRNGIYYFHKKVNKELSTNKNQIIRKSLQTKCYTTAKQLASLLNYWANEYFKMGIVMTSEKMDEILFNYFQDSLEEYSELEELRHQKNSVEIDDKNYEGSTKKAILYHLKKYDKLNKTREFLKIQEYVNNEIIPISKIEENDLKELEQEKEFYWKLFKYYGEVLKTDLSKFEGYSVEESIDKHKKNKNQVVVEPKKKRIKEDSFEVMVNMYINHLIKKQKIIEDTKKDYVPSYNLINEAFPNKKLSELTTKDLEKLEHLICFLPANRNKKKFTRDLDIHKQADFMENILKDRANKVFRLEHKEYKAIGLGTQNKHFEQITNFIEFCSAKYKFESPLNGIVLQRYRIKNDSSLERLPLSDEELQIIFNEFDYLNQKLLFALKNDPLKVYGIFLTMYLGLRPAEAGQLMVNDLQHTKDKDGNIIYYLRVSKENTSEDINLNDIKKEKTENTKRKLPLTDIFIKDLKFLEFVNQRKEDNHNFIFVNEEENLDIKQNIKNTVRRCEDTFNTKLKKLNFENLDRKSFYSLRHSFANKIKHIPEALKDKRGESLMGHSGATDSELFNRYGNKYFEPDFLYEILEKVEYEEFDFEYISKEIDRLLK